MLTRLVLTREPGEAVTLDWCGEPFGRVVVYQVVGNKVRLGFELEDHVRVMRQELHPVAADAATEVDL